VQYRAGDPAALSTVLGRLLPDTARRERLAAAAVSGAQAQDIDIVAVETLAFYRSLGR
jgi:hypothetical protein